ncbi:MAG: DNA polymerase III subunit delta [Lachnospiraceae bacterium]|nr:DNA polymerase III subunit delta [Lachnospiraceae bacterium]
MQQITEILENKRNIEHLAEAFARDRLSHAYIINGPAGSGKKTFARYFAAALLCDKMHGGGDDGQTDLFSMFAIEKPKEARLSDGPCGSCPACAKSLSGNHPDIIFLKREKEKVIQVGEVRQQIIDDVSIKPYYGPYKIYIVEDAHLMNESAQNAILKTIEEPPEYVIIFLLSENADSFLDTIRSRCIRLDMEKLSRDTIMDYLKDRLGVSGPQAERAAAYARGNLGEAIDLSVSQESAETIQGAVDVLKKLKTMNAADIFDEAAAFGKEDPAQILKVSRMWFRDILVLKAEGKDLHSELYFPAEKEALKRFSDNVAYEKLENVMKAIDTAQTRLEANVKAEAVLEVLFLTIRRNIKW